MQTSSSSTPINEYAIFAERFQVPAHALYTLPSVFEKFAQYTGEPVRSILSQATYFNVELGEYAKEIALKVA